MIYFFKNCVCVRTCLCVCAHPLEARETRFLEARITSGCEPTVGAEN